MMEHGDGDDVIQNYSDPPDGLDFPAVDDHEGNRIDRGIPDRVGYVEDSDDDDALDCRSVDAEQESSFANEGGKCLPTQYSDKSLSRINKSRVGKIYNEGISVAEEKSMYVTGSCLGSQEPGVLSQANAMDVVDKLLCDNELASSQNFDYPKAQGSSSPPNSRARGSHFLAKWAHHRSSIGKSEIFDWAEGNNCFSKNKVGKQKTAASVHTSKVKEGNLVYPRITSLTFSEPKLVVKSPTTQELNISEADIKDYGNENYLNSTSLEQRDATHDGDELDMHDVGPNTQMAAEAMEALFYASPINYELRKDAHPVTGILAEDKPSIGMSMVKSAEDNPAEKQICSTHELEGNTVQSKEKQVRRPRLSNVSSRSFKQRYGNSKVKKRKMTNENVKMKNNCDLQPRINNRNPPKASKTPSSFKEDKECNDVEHIFFKEGRKCGILRNSNMQHSVSKRPALGEVPSNVAPVAYQTRQSKSLKLSKCAETSLYGYGHPVTRLFESTSEQNTGEVKLVSDTSRLLSSKGKGPKKGVNEVAKLDKGIGKYSELQDVKEHPKEETQMSSSIFWHPKRRRTHRIISGKMKKTYFAVNNHPSKIAQCSARQGENDMHIKGSSDVFIAIKRKKRSSCTRRRSSAPGVGTNSSFNSSLVDPCLGKDPAEYKPAFGGAGSMVVMNSSSSLIHNLLPFKKVEPECTDAASISQDIKEKSKLDGPFRRKDHPFGLECSVPLKSMESVSHIPKTQDHERTSHKKGSQKSPIARELRRLQPAKAPFPCLLKEPRKRKYMANIRVLFSNHLDEDIIKQQKKILARLGVATASSASDATHFVSDKFARTKNMLEMMAMGKPVVTPMWLTSCGATNYFSDEKKYILRDLKKENYIGFSMPGSLDHARQCPLLQGRRLFITPNVKPDRELIASLVKAAHGQTVKSICNSTTEDGELPEDLLVISCEEDYSICSSLLDKGVKVFSSELLLNGIVVQKLEFERHRLFSDHGKKICSSKSSRLRRM